MKIRPPSGWIDSSFKFDPTVRQQAIKDFSKKFDAEQVALFFDRCERIIIRWLSMKKTRTPDTEYRTRLLALKKGAIDLHRGLAAMPADCAYSMHVESYPLKSRLGDFVGELEKDLCLLAELSKRCLDRVQPKPGKERRHIEVLVITIILAYQDIFNKKPSISKSNTSTLFIFLQSVVANAIREEIGFDLYRECVKKGVGLP